MSGVHILLGVLGFLFVVLMIIVIVMAVQQQKENEKPPKDEDDAPPPPEKPDYSKPNNADIPIETEDVPLGEYNVGDKPPPPPPISTPPPSSSPSSSPGGTGGTGGASSTYKSNSTCNYGFDIPTPLPSPVKCSLNPEFLNQYKLRATDYGSCPNGMTGPNANGECFANVIIDSMNPGGCGFHCLKDLCSGLGGETTFAVKDMFTFDVKCKLPNKSLVSPGSAGVVGKDVCPKGYAGPNASGLCVSMPGTNKHVSRFNCLRHGGKYKRVEGNYDECDMSGEKQNDIKTDYPCKIGNVSVPDWYKFRESDEDYCYSRTPNDCFVQESGVYVPKDDYTFAWGASPLESKARHCNANPQVDCWLYPVRSGTSNRDLASGKNCINNTIKKWPTKEYTGKEESITTYVQPGDICKIYQQNNGKEFVGIKFCDPNSGNFVNVDYDLKKCKALYGNAKSYTCEYNE